MFQVFLAWELDVAFYGLLFSCFPIQFIVLLGDFGLQATINIGLNTNYFSFRHFT